MFNNDAARWLGKRVKVYWGAYKRWYTGTVTDYDPNLKEPWKVTYDDEDVIWELEEDLRLIESPSKGESPNKRKREDLIQTEQESKKLISVNVDASSPPSSPPPSPIKESPPSPQLTSPQKQSKKTQQTSPKTKSNTSSSPKSPNAKAEKSPKKQPVFVEKEEDATTSSSASESPAPEQKEAHQDSNKFLHQRVKVFWGAYKKYYYGYVSEYDPRRSRCYKVEYDDGDMEWEYPEDLILYNKSKK
jgi:hypothetical protein